MKILLDNNIPTKMRRMLMPRDVWTSAYMGWTLLQNGQLLTAAEGAGFELLVTADKNLAYQQNLKHRKIALVVLSTPRWSIIQNHAVTIRAAIDAATPGSFAAVDC
jgi:hypothetical protein